MNPIKMIGALLLTGLLSSPALAQVDNNAEAEESAAAWLARADAADYASTWDMAAALFRNSVARDEWVRMAASVRSPLGAVRSRALKSRASPRPLPGVPDGQYVAVRYDTTFENKNTSVETVTLMLEADEAWRVIGYFIR